MLLHAALDEGPGARRAWEQLRHGFDFDQLTGDRYRLAPLLGWNLEQAGLGPGEDPVVAHLLGLTRRTWLQAQRHEAAACAVKERLALHGIECLMFKGVALARSAYPTLGLRPMEDIDVLVRQSDMAGAIAVLLSAGYRRADSPWAVHAETLMAPEGIGVDVHAHPGPLLVRHRRHPGVSAMWGGRVEVGLDEARSFSALSATDELLVVLEHGVSSPESAPIRWIADAAWLARTGEIDWQQFNAQVARFGNSFSVGLALELMSGIGIEVAPSQVRSEVHRMSDGAVDRFLLASLRERRFPSAARVMLQLLLAEDPRHRLPSVPRNASESLQLPSLRSLPSTALRRGRAYTRRLASE